MRISLSDGWTDTGGGRIKVFYQDNLVLYADRYAKNEERLIPKTKEWGILEYHSGEWENQLKEFMKEHEEPFRIKKPKPATITKLIR